MSDEEFAALGLNPAEWVTIQQAMRIVRRGRNTIYVWLRVRGPKAIRRIKPERELLLHLHDLNQLATDMEAHVGRHRNTPIGR